MSAPIPRPTRESVSDPDVVVRTFLEALAAGSTDTAAGLLADDVWWENVGFPVVRGKKPVVAALRTMEHRCRFDVVNHHLAVEAPRDPTDPSAPVTVLTERTDALSVGRFRCAFWVCGRFEVRDGVICGWKDHFSLGNMAAGALRGLRDAIRR